MKGVLIAMGLWLFLELYSRAEDATPSPAMSLPESISLEQFREFVTGKRGLVLDVRAEEFYRAGHVPGAISLPDLNFETGYARLRSFLTAKKGKPIVVYCSSETCSGSEWIQKQLLNRGFTHVSRFRGGWQAWTEAGLGQEVPSSH